LQRPVSFVLRNDSATVVIGQMLNISYQIELIKARYVCVISRVAPFQRRMYHYI